jgi:tetraacyldisaccharide 4'-kinase
MPNGRARAGLERWLVRQWQAPRPPVALWLAWPLAWVWSVAVTARRALYRSGVLQALPAPRPTVVVGNLVAGGAGKTPIVLALVDHLRASGHRPGVIARGHGRSGAGTGLVTRLSAARDVGDEPLLVHLRTGVPVAVGRDRVAAALALCSAHPELTVIVSDDGLQHLRLARDAQIIAFDDRGVGNGHVLPLGPLREPMPRALPPRTIVIYTRGSASTPWPGLGGTRRLATFWPLADWWKGDATQAVTAHALRHRPLLAAAGLARPEGFFAMLREVGLTVRELPLADHASFDPLPWSTDEREVVVTEKDAVKLAPERVGATRVWVARLDFDLPPDFDAALASWLPRPQP